MRYVGSKNRLSKELAPIIQSYINDNCKGYIEPFVGGANMIDKIKCDNKIGYDINNYLIALLNHAKITTDDFPDEITREHYYSVKNNKDNYDEWYVGLIGFCGSFSAKFWGGYATHGNNPKYRKTPYNEAKNNIIKQSVNLKDIKFECKDYKDLDNLSGYVIYCDPPYKGVLGYKSKFNHEEFYEWLRKISLENIVLISEYEMPDDFECIWEKDILCQVSRQNKLKSNNDNKRTEKLFMYKNGIKSL